MPDWEDLVESNAPKLWRVCFRILRDHDASADCVQEVFLTALKISDSASIKDWPRWLTCIATRRALDQLRKTCRARERDRMIRDLDSLSVNRQAPDETAVASELAIRLRAALGELPRQQAEVFCLRCLDNLTYAEIGQQLSLEASHIGVLLHWTRRRLQQLLTARVENSQ